MVCMERSYSFYVGMVLYGRMSFLDMVGSWSIQNYTWCLYGKIMGHICYDHGFCVVGSWGIHGRIMGFVELFV